MENKNFFPLCEFYFSFKSFITLDFFNVKILKFNQNNIMVTITSYIVLLLGTVAVTLGVYLGLLRVVKLI
jgi:hypothetical protein